MVTCADVHLCGGCDGDAGAAPLPQGAAAGRHQFTKDPATSAFGSSREGVAAGAMLGGRHGGPRHWEACLRRRQLRLPVPASRPRRWPWPWCSSAARTTATSRSRCNRLVRRRCLPCCHRLGPAPPQLPQRLIHRINAHSRHLSQPATPGCSRCRRQDAPWPLGAPSPPPSRSLPRNVELGDFSHAATTPRGHVIKDRQHVVPYV